jgi:hypothetical protein
VIYNCSGACSLTFVFVSTPNIDAFLKANNTFVLSLSTQAAVILGFAGVLKFQVVDRNFFCVTYYGNDYPRRKQPQSKFQ